MNPEMPSLNNQEADNQEEKSPEELAAELFPGKSLESTKPPVKELLGQEGGELERAKTKQAIKMAAACMVLSLFAVGTSSCAISKEIDLLIEEKIAKDRARTQVINDRARAEHEMKEDIKFKEGRKKAIKEITKYGKPLLSSFGSRGTDRLMGSFWEGYFDRVRQWEDEMEQRRINKADQEGRIEVQTEMIRDNQ